MKQTYHTIIRPDPKGCFVGWVEEMPGAITSGRSLDECRRKLKDALELLVDTHRHEARQAMDATCIQEPLEIETPDPADGAASQRHLLQA